MWNCYICLLCVIGMFDCIFRCVNDFVFFLFMSGIIFFNGIFEGVSYIVGAFDYTTLAGTFGAIGVVRTIWAVAVLAPDMALCLQFRSCPISCWQLAWLKSSKVSVVWNALQPC